MTAGVRVQYFVSQNVPKIARHVERSRNALRLQAKSCLDTEYSQPFGAESQRGPGTRSRSPGTDRQRVAGPAQRGVGREDDGSGCAGRARAQANERHRRAPLDMEQRSLPAAPPPDRI